MVKLLVEVLKKELSIHGESWILEKARTIDFGEILSAEEKLRARTKLEELRLQLSNDYKIRVIEYRNDEPDRTRKACKILYEN